MTDKSLLVALVGNPNSGKSCIFNQLTASHAKVGNWGGVTVEGKTGALRSDRRTFNIMDLPGLYSLSTVSPDEEITRDLIIHGDAQRRRPDLIIHIIDGCQLERSLYLTLQLLDQDIPLVIALNMFDEMRKRRLIVDIKAISGNLGLPIIPTVANRGEGIRELVDTMQQIIDDKAFSPALFRFDYATEKALSDIQEIFSNSGFDLSRGRLIGLLTNAPSADKDLPGELVGRSREVAESAKPAVGETWIDAITHARYKAISILLAKSVAPRLSRDDKLTSRLDGILLHNIWGIPIFLLIIFLLFQATFSLGALPMRGIDAGMSFLSNQIKFTKPGFWGELFGDGIVGGVGMMLSFVPTVLILLTGIYFIEDTGYMARAAFLMDRVMRLIGLHGRAFIPLMMGFGCNVPALFASRSIGNPRDRLLTMLLTPLMSCSARLPIYVMVTAAFFPKYGSLVIFSLYLLGALLALGLGRLLSRTLLTGPPAPFVMELPVYRFPSLKNILRQIGFMAGIFAKRIGTFIVFFAVFIWFLSNFPYSKVPPGSSQSPEISATSIESAESLAKRDKYIHYLGQFIEPVMRPLGFTVEMDIALVSGLIAKEAVVVTMGVLLTGASDTDKDSLIEQLRKNIPSTAAALAFLVFVLLYIPCLSTIVTLQYENRQWIWTAFSIGYLMAVAYIAAFVTYRLGMALGLG